MTATSIADLSLAALTETVARAIARYPEQRGRIERAAQLIATGHVGQVSADLWAVRSQTDETVYVVDSDGCPCQDAKRHPGQSCKHVWAIDLLLVAQERTRRLERATAPRATTDGRAYLAELIEQRQRFGLIAAAEGRPAIADERCVKLDEMIARVRRNLQPVSFHEVAA